MTQPVPVPLSDLTTPSTPDEILDQSLQKAQQLGLPTTAWQPIQMIPDVIEVNATIAADQTQLVALIAQGGYASLAALMVDASGKPITTWMALRATDQYGITPGAATFASGPVPYTNSGSNTYPYSPASPLHFQNVTTGATYTSTGTGSVTPGTGTIAVAADVAGSASTTAANVTLVLTTPLTGVSLTAQVLSLVGTDAESNAALLTRGRNKLATLAPLQSTDIPGPVVGGASGVFDYVAKSIPQAPTASATPPYAVSATITRTHAFTGGGNGSVALYIANANGTPNATDISAVNAACQALVVFDTQTLTVFGAVPVLVSFTGTIWIPASSGFTFTAVTTNALDALANLLASVPIGGRTTSAANILPTSELVDTIFDSNPGTVDVQLSLTAPIPIGNNGVTQLGTVTLAVVFI
jgi:hypothetical protein